MRADVSRAYVARQGASHAGPSKPAGPLLPSLFSTSLSHSLFPLVQALFTAYGCPGHPYRIHSIIICELFKNSLLGKCAFFFIFVYLFSTPARSPILRMDIHPLPRLLSKNSLFSEEISKISTFIPPRRDPSSPFCHIVSFCSYIVFCLLSQSFVPPHPPARKSRKSIRAALSRLPGRHIPGPIGTRGHVIVFRLYTRKTRHFST